MDNILVRMKPDLKAAAEMVHKLANNRFHIKICETGAELKTIQVGSMSSCTLGVYSAQKLTVGGRFVDTWVQSAMKSDKWPKSVKYANGVLFIESAPVTIEPEPEFPGDLSHIGFPELIFDEDDSEELH